jgi:hypothetical protein
VMEGSEEHHPVKDYGVLVIVPPHHRVLGLNHNKLLIKYELFCILDTKYFYIKSVT